MSESFLVPCGPDYNLCATKMAVDWLSEGDQTIQFTRMCSNKTIYFGQECTQGGNAVNGLKLSNSIQIIAF